MLTTAKTEKLGTGFAKNAGEWTRRVEIGKKFLAVSVACMAIYWPSPGFEGKTFKLCVLSRWDFSDKLVRSAGLPLSAFAHTELPGQGKCFEPLRLHSCARHLILFFGTRAVDILLLIIMNPLTARVVGAPQMILQPVFSTFPSSPLPSGTCRIPASSLACINY